MLAKKTVKNQVTLPKKIVERFPTTTYFDVSVEDDAIVLRPVDPAGAPRVRQKLRDLGITGDDLRDAIAWAREGDRRKDAT